MEDILLFVVIIPFFIAGYYLVKRIDLFLEDNHRAREANEEPREADLVIVAGGRPLNEIEREIEHFRRKHEDFEIILKNKEGK